MGKADDVSRLDSPKAPHPALKTHILLALDLLPVVPADTADVQEQVQPSTRKMPDSSMADAQRGLDEIASRGEHFPGELGDLGPDPKLAGALRTELARGEAVITRLEALLRDVTARMTVLKGQAVTLLDDAHEQIVQREQRGRIQPESYAHVHRFVAARGEAITEGIVRAKALKAAQKGAANDASAVKKTG
jgi:hypothetical protein